MQAVERLQRGAQGAIDRAAERLDQTRAGRFALDTARAALTVLHHLRQESVLERAAALSYGTMLALVPLLGVSFAIANAVGHEFLLNRLRHFVFDFLQPGIHANAEQVLRELIDRASSGGVVSISGAALFVSSVGLLRSIESGLNAIWGVQKPRSLWLRLATYLTLLVFGPVLLATSLAMTAFLRHFLTHAGFAMAATAYAVGPFFVAVAGLTVLYKYAPNAQVRKRAAFAGALVAGVLFEAAKHAYAFYTANFVSYSMIYGSLAAIPLFLIWVYVSWIVVLFGARLAYAVQNAGSWGHAALPKSESMRARLAARTMLAAAVARASGRQPPSIHTVARAAAVNEAAVAESVRMLIKAGLLAEDVRGGLIPARPLEEITVADVARAANFGDEDRSVLGQDPASRAIAALFDDAERLGRAPLAQLDLRALAEPLLGEIPAR